MGAPNLSVTLSHPVERLGPVTAHQLDIIEQMAVATPDFASSPIHAVTRT